MFRLFSIHTPAAHPTISTLAAPPAYSPFESPALRMHRYHLLYRTLNPALLPTLNPDVLSRAGNALRHHPVGRLYAYGLESHVRSMEKNGGCVDWDGFKMWMERMESRMMRLFWEVDDGDGRLTLAELSRALLRCDIVVDESELKVMMAQVDMDGDGTIDFNEWRTFLTDVAIAAIPSPSEGIASVLTQGSSLRHTLATGVRIGGDATPDACYLPHPHPHMFPPASVYNHGTVGVFAAAFSRTMTAPLDRVRILAMTARNTSSFGVPGASMPQIGLRVVMEEGWRGLFRGNGINLLKAIPETYARFRIFDRVKRILSSRAEVPVGYTTLKQMEEGEVIKSYRIEADLNMAGRIAASGVSAAAVLAVTHPFDTLKTVYQSHLGDHRVNIKEIASKLVETGKTGWYRGFGVAAWTVLPFLTIEMTAFDALKSRWEASQMSMQSRDSTELSAGIGRAVGFGAASGALATVATYPLLIARARIQAAAIDTSSYSQSAFRVLRNVWRHQGFRGMYRGIVPTLLKASVTAATTFAVYDAVVCQTEMALPAARHYA